MQNIKKEVKILTKKSSLYNSLIKLFKIFLEFVWSTGNREKCSKTIVYNKFYIAGYQYYKGNSLALRVEDILQMKRERNNKYDVKAIALFFKGVKVGFVPQRENGIISSLLDQDIKIYAHVIKVDCSRPTWERILVELRGRL